MAGCCAGSGIGRARAAEPDRAGAAAGLHVGRLTAGPVGDSDRPDRIPGVLAVQQRGGVSPEAISVPVGLHRGDLVDGLAVAARRSRVRSRSSR